MASRKPIFFRLDAPRRTEERGGKGSVFQFLFSFLFSQADICATDGALEFLVGLLDHRSTAIVENGGGILRNISNYIAACDDEERYR